jgi:hypothetical protein
LTQELQLEPSFFSRYAGFNGYQPGIRNGEAFMATPRSPRKRADKSKLGADQTESGSASSDVEDAVIVPDPDPETEGDNSAAKMEEASLQISEDPSAMPVADDAPELPAPVAADTAAEPASDPKELLTDPDVAADLPVSEPQTTPEEAEAPAASDPEPQAQPEPERSVETASHAPSRPAPAPAPAKGGSGFFALLMGGVAAAALGFALARFVVPEGWPMPGSSPLQTQITAQSAEIESLKTQLASLQAAPSEDPLAPVQAEIEALRELAQSALAQAQAAQTAIAELPAPSDAPAGTDLGPALAALEARLAALETRPAPESGADPQALAAVAAEISALQAEMEAQKAAATAAVVQMEQEIAAAAEAAKAAAEQQAQSLRLKASVAQIEASVESGAPFAEPLAVLAAGGAEIPALLSETAETGVPSIQALSEAFGDPARAALGVSLRNDMGDGALDRLGAFLRSQTGARSLEPRAGDDADAILSRAEAAIRAGDMAQSLAEIAALSEPAQAEMAGWVAQVEHRIAVQAAVASLLATLSEG